MCVGDGMARVVRPITTGSGGEVQEPGVVGGDFPRPRTTGGHCSWGDGRGGCTSLLPPGLHVWMSGRPGWLAGCVGGRAASLAVWVGAWAAGLALWVGGWPGWLCGWMGDR